MHLRQRAGSDANGGPDDEVVKTTTAATDRQVVHRGQRTQEFAVAGPLVAVGSHERMHGFAAGTTRLTVEHQGQYTSIDLTSGTASAIPVTLDNTSVLDYLVIPAGGRCRLGLQVRTDETDTRYSIVRVGGTGTPPLCAPDAPDSWINQRCTSPHGDYVAVETVSGDAGTSDQVNGSEVFTWRSWPGRRRHTAFGEDQHGRTRLGRPARRQQRSRSLFDQSRAACDSRARHVPGPYSRRQPQGVKMKTLPMLGRTHGNRSAVTCHLKCDDACSRPTPNQSVEPSFRDIASGQLSRRNVLVGTGALAVAAALPSVTLETAAAAGRGGSLSGSAVRGTLAFAPIRSVELTRDAVTVPEGFQWTPILRWGDQLFIDSPRFNPNVADADAQELQFGYNNDYLDILLTGRRGREALLVCNHEYTNRDIMFPPSTDAAQEAEVLRTLMAAHGMSVVNLRRLAKGRPWTYVRGGRNNRRITANTPFQLTGPAAGTDLVKTAADPTGRRALGTIGNCSGGTTPWGTVLSGEENFNGYFVADPAAVGSARYGLTDKPSTYGWEKIEPRFDATQPGYANEPHRFGYIVEIDPTDPTSVPLKHTAMGRFKHEGANVRVDADGTVAAYMGDDEKFDYLYKFVSKRKYRPGGSAAARRHNKLLLTEGDLYVARFSGTQNPGNDNLGRGAWIPLTLDGTSVVPGMSVEEVLVFTRLAADLMKATPMDRCEDVQPSLETGKVYVVCTNNDIRGTAGKPGTDAANPRPINKNGHIIEISEHHDEAGATTFAWNLFLVCGDVDQAGTYFGGWTGPVAPISCPDNIAFDAENNLWIATDGQPGSIKKADGLFRAPLSGAERGHVVQFLAVPHGAETCGPVIHDRDGSVFVAVQHPGENGTWAEQQSYFPDYVSEGESVKRGEWRGPRPSVIQITRRN